MEVDIEASQRLQGPVSLSELGRQVAGSDGSGLCLQRCRPWAGLDPGRLWVGSPKEIFESPLGEDFPNSWWELEPRKCSLCC